MNGYSERQEPDAAALEALAGWLVSAGLTGLTEMALLEGFSQRLCAAGVAVSRSVAIIDTLHPIFEGRAFRWRDDGVEEEGLIEYGPTTDGELAEKWRRSMFQDMLNRSLSELRCPLIGPDLPDYSHMEDMQATGSTDCLAFIHHFAPDGVMGGMDCVYSYCLTRQTDGFSAGEQAALRRLMPLLALSLKTLSLARIAGTLTQVYLGRDAGQRVLSGRISRGVADRINAVLWFSDLRGYTRISDSAAPDAIIPLLNDYADVTVSAIHNAGGDVLKLIGDGTLAIFKADDPADACRAALDAWADLRVRLRELKQRRTAAGQPVTDIYLGLHIGDVFYGNIGGQDRLDFTVVGPAVNEVARIVSMCRSVDRSLVTSDAFAASSPPEARARLVSVGRYALRGVGRAQELFTLDPTLI
ncbi:adenylate/guanylate cyclase domain-containing protein [Niveispirillum sp. SYP-B3756]|uniref:adenylate/guanylate cyclase domain-containing protein n=1 Tax=Niveispirillum sp. SYP-B3756 TaxID=2662178 RepID=UPI001FFF55A9|nr:adenylate/guanylate cyclase domain-containing protein [Niveispirillum sp. SYP-B3756]